VYVDETAIGAHRAAPHFAEWNAAAEEHLEPGGRTRVVGRRLFHHTEEEV
jgi:quinol monooxygenase YgiN